MSQSTTGKVKFFNGEKGFGFIVPENGKKDLFFHVTGLAPESDKPQEGDNVTFDIEDGKKGKKAVNIAYVD